MINRQTIVAVLIDNLRDQAFEGNHPLTFDAGDYKYARVEGRVNLGALADAILEALAKQKPE